MISDVYTNDLDHNDKLAMMHEDMERKTLNMNHLEAALIGQDNDPIPEASPAPWHKSYTDTQEGVSDCDIYITDADGVSVCKCVFPYGDSIRRRKDSDIIAAAPELLSALEALLDCPEWETFTVVSQELVKAQDAADDAIRKAKGECHANEKCLTAPNG